MPLPTNPATLQPLPAAFHATLAAGLTALALELDERQLAALDAYVRLLLAWTASINLTAIREPGAVARDHILDSLSAVAVLRGLGAARLVDLGSGGGLPGIPLAIVLGEARVLLVESVGKKALFLRTAVHALGLERRVAVAAERAEDLAVGGREREAHDVVVVRAVAPLPELIELSFPLVRVGGALVAWKREPLAPDLAAGRPALDAELAAGRNAGQALHGELSVEQVGIEGLRHHRLVIVTKRRTTPHRFPRPPAERRARPL